MESVAIKAAVRRWLDERPYLRACGSCPIGCDDMTKFICMGGSVKDLEEFLNRALKDIRKEFESGGYSN